VNGSGQVTEPLLDAVAALGGTFGPTDDLAVGVNHTEADGGFMQIDTDK